MTVKPKMRMSIETEKKNCNFRMPCNSRCLQKLSCGFPLRKRSKENHDQLLGELERRWGYCYMNFNDDRAGKANLIHWDRCRNHVVFAKKCTRGTLEDLQNLNDSVLLSHWS